MPGAISPATGLVKNANSTWLNGRPLQHRPRRRARPAGPRRQRRQLLRAVGGDRRRGGGRGERLRRDPRHRRRRRRGRRRRLVSGPNAIAGEWGHNPLPWPRDDERPGPACYCGRAGCIETWLSGPACRDRRRRGRRRASRARRAEIAARAAAGRRRWPRRRWRATRIGWRAASPDDQRARSARHRARRRPLEPRPALRERAGALAGTASSPTASTPGWCRRSTATRAACAARRGCGRRSKGLRRPAHSCQRRRQVREDAGEGVDDLRVEVTAALALDDFAAPAPAGCPACTAGRASSRRRHRRARRCGRRAGCPRPSGRAGSRGRPSARDGRARSPRPSAAAARGCPRGCARPSPGGCE